MRREKIKLYENRIRVFIKTIEERSFLPKQIPFDVEAAATKTAVAFENIGGLTFKPMAAGTAWGEAWDSAWFRLSAVVPAEWRGRAIVAHLNFGGEACVFDSFGTPINGLTNTSVFNSQYVKDIHFIKNLCGAGERIELLVEAAANGLFGVPRDADPSRCDPKRHGSYEARLTVADLCVFNDEAWSLILDMKLLLSLMERLPEHSPRRTRILSALSKAVDIYADDPVNVVEARRVLLEGPLSARASASSLGVLAVGHAHIDTAWLWPVSETIRKCARTFSSQVELIRQCPGYVFGASQAQLYAFVKTHYPELYAEVKRLVAAGNWEVQGGMWVEADCNLIGGESMVRQFLHGKNFFKDEFGVDVKNLWLPDVFGYSAAMPQIMRKAGVDFFLTQKISWSQFNEFPHNTFKWRGIDGSEVITHFPPENTYNSDMEPASLIAAESRFKENDTLDEFMCLFGIGDGGGGPKLEHISRAIRMRDLEGCPKVAFGKAEHFFDRLRKRESELDTWYGELYLELHRGTLTTQARTKKGNRLLEASLRATEIVYSCLPLQHYPAQELDRIWKTLLLNQFHDIIPGSSIHAVYELTERQHADCLEECASLVAEAAPFLFQADPASVVVFNTLSTEVDAIVDLPVSWVGHAVGCDDIGDNVPTQTVDGFFKALVRLAPLSFSTLSRLGLVVNEPRSPKNIAEDSDSDTLVLENSLVRYEFDKCGVIVAAYDKEQTRQILGDCGKGNVLSLYVDRPNAYDAWDIDNFYEGQHHSHAAGVSAKRLPKGDIGQTIQFILRIGESDIEQSVSLRKTSKMLVFETKVQWRETHKMLRAAFQTCVTAERATFDIQYGHVRRNTHRNQSWDMAKFEVPAHKYVDLSDRSYGVALLNDCKYGHKVLDNVIDINLLRSPTNPDPDADIGAHSFTYCLLPHARTLLDSDVLPEAWLLNNKPLVFTGWAKGLAKAPCAIKSEAVSIEVIKKAEKEDCLVVRLVELKGQRSKADIKFHGASMVSETDLMEWNDEWSLPSIDGAMTLYLNPFEIKTIKIRK